jgi:hypothetical protein
MADIVKVLGQMTPDKNVTWKKRLHGSNHASAGRTFNSQARIENIETKPASQIASGNELMFALRARAIPNLIGTFHF